VILQVKLSIGVDSTKLTVDFEVDSTISEVTLLLTGKTGNLNFSRIERGGKRLFTTT